MAKSASAGELRTRIVIKDFIGGRGSTDESGFSTDERQNIFPDGRHYRCKWVNVHGLEVYSARQAQLKEPATLTMRYIKELTPTAEIYREDDPRPYEVISVNDVENRHVWLEVKVQRKVSSR